MAAAAEMDTTAPPSDSLPRVMGARAPSVRPETPRLPYAERVPVTVRNVRTGTEREAASLFVQVRLGSAVVSRLRSVSVQLTDADDPFFLYQFEVSEEDYPRLKAEQSLFVDFAQFPRLIVDYFEQCRQASSGFHATLTEYGSDGGDGGVAETATTAAAAAASGKLCICETTRFRNLPHLCLHMAPGSDTAVKRYLAARWQEAARRNAELEAALEEAQSRFAERTCRMEQLAAQVAQLQSERVQATNELRAQHQAALTEARERALQTLMEKQNEWQQERRALEERYGGEQRASTERLERAEADVRRLMQERYASEAQIRQLETRLAAERSECEALRRELDKAREEQREIARQQHQLQRQVDAAGVERQSLERALADKDAWMERMRQMLESATAQKQTLEQTLLAQREARARLERQLEAAAVEIERGNAMLERLQSALREAKAKARLKAAVAEQQEAVLRERQRQVEQLREQAALWQRSMRQAPETLGGFTPASPTPSSSSHLAVP